MFSATHSLKGLSCLNSPGTPQRHSADLRRQPNFAEKSVIAAISCVEQRSFKIPQLPALWAEVAGVGVRTTPPLSPAAFSAHRKAPRHAPKWAGWYPYPTSTLRGHKSAHRRQHGGQWAQGAVWLGIFLFLLLFCSKIAIFRGEISRLFSR